MGLKIIKLKFFLINKIYQIKILLFLLLILVILSLHTSVILSKYYQEIISHTVSYPLEYVSSLHNITIEGVVRSNINQIQKFLKFIVGKSILNFSLTEVQKKIFKSSWIHEIRIYRIFPKGLLIILNERFPKALWSVQEKLFLLDSGGQVINITNLKPFFSLPILVGKGANKKGIHFLKTIKKYPDILQNIKYARYVSERRWDLYLGFKNLKIQLSENFTDKIFIHLQDLISDKRIKWDLIETLDLRLDDKAFFLLKNNI